MLSIPDGLMQSDVEELIAERINMLIFCGPYSHKASDDLTAGASQKKQSVRRCQWRINFSAYAVALDVYENSAFTGVNVTEFILNQISQIHKTHHLSLAKVLYTIGGMGSFDVPICERDSLRYCEYRKIACPDNWGFKKNDTGECVKACFNTHVNSKSIAQLQRCVRAFEVLGCKIDSCIQQPQDGGMAFILTSTEMRKLYTLFPSLKPKHRSYFDEISRLAKT